ncbi:MAG: hypothetical protein MUF20_09290 [Methylotetracoccus sp.]|jgi:hypothetical protein|nr:hypothetical protein [Methylotetracoccus sp.]
MSDDLPRFRSAVGVPRRRCGWPVTRKVSARTSPTSAPSAQFSGDRRGDTLAEIAQRFDAKASAYLRIVKVDLEVI